MTSSGAMPGGDPARAAAGQAGGRSAARSATRALARLERLLGAAPLTGLQRAAYGRPYDSGPWCWPGDDHDPADLARLAAALGVAGPPRLRPGQVLGVTVRRESPQHVTLWLLGEPVPLPSTPSPAGVHAAHLAGDALASWSRAARVLPQALPVVWGSVRAAAADPPRALRLTSSADAASGALPERALDGPSLGLALLVALASRVVGRPAVSDLAALAALGPEGALVEVDALGPKIEAVGGLAPRVRRVVVASAQREEARVAALPFGIEVHALAHAGAALDLALPDLAAALIGGDLAARRERAEQIFRLALVDREELWAWRPVAEAARRLREEEPGLGEDVAARLRFAEAVARRHDENRGVVATPGAWLERLPLPTRLELVSHVVQQAADTGTPTAEEAANLVARWRVPRIEAFGGHLQLLGAWGRLLAVTGRPEEALAVQREAVEGWLERWRPDEASRPICEWLRLATALGDAEALAAGERLAGELEDRQLLGGRDVPYLRLARLRSAVERGVDLERARAGLVDLADGEATPLGLRAPALRWAVRASESLSDPDQAGRCRARLDALAAGAGAAGAAGAAAAAQAAAEARAMLALGDALARRAAPAEVDAALAALGAPEVAPQPTRLLVEAAGRRGEHPARYVLCWFPY